MTLQVGARVRNGKRSLTNRQGALLILALAYVGQSTMMFHNPGLLIHDQAILYEWWPLWVRLGLWIIPALLMAVTAVSHNVMHQVVGWQAAIIPVLVHLASHLWSLLMWIIPGAPGGSLLSVSYITWWSAIGGLVLFLSRMDDDGLDENA